MLEIETFPRNASVEKWRRRSISETLPMLAKSSQVFLRRNRAFRERSFGMEFGVLVCFLRAYVKLEMKIGLLSLR